MKIRQLKQSIGEDWEDVEQDARVQMVEKYPGQPLSGALWYKVLKHTAINYLEYRHAQKRDNRADVSLDSTPVRFGAEVIKEDIGYHNRLEDEGRWEEKTQTTIDVRKALQDTFTNKLERLVMELACNGSITGKKASEILGWPTSTTSKWLKEGRRKLAKRLKGYGNN